jgi:hypothetical protein
VHHELSVGTEQRLVRGTLVWVGGCFVLEELGARVFLGQLRTNTRQGRGNVFTHKKGKALAPVSGSRAADFADSLIHTCPVGLLAVTKRLTRTIWIIHVQDAGLSKRIDTARNGRVQWIASQVGRATIVGRDH